MPRKSEVHRPLKHLPKDQWPSGDRLRFELARQPRDIFDESAPSCSNWSEGTWRRVETPYRRWLGFLALEFPADLLLPAEKRIIPERVKGFVEHLVETIRDTSIVINLEGLLMAARLLAPDDDFDWLSALKNRLAIRARPMERLSKLKMPWDTLALGLSLMDGAMIASPRNHLLNEIEYRDGLIIALLSLWPIRRRSMAALTGSRHIVRSCNTLTINLFGADTKTGRPHSFVVPAKLSPYLIYYLDVVRPRLLKYVPHDALWVSQHGKELTAGSVYLTIRKHTREHFGAAMGMHDFRRAAATSLALEAPDKVGLASSLLQHAKQDTTGRHYNLAGMAHASRRFREAIDP
ncbi:hypothetical protein [Mesorhizobium sp. KR9-304]|uniref:hypothetical protein n=1 Tax=Mesorhizobium sp. KR9-304 TaxID=3156614 RepID=UPI0032B39966